MTYSSAPILIQKPTAIRARKDFLRARDKGIKAVAQTMVVQYAPPHERDPQAVRMGYTVTKKCGNAVKRNRIKRKFRAALQEQCKTHGMPPAGDYVLIARPYAYEAEYSIILRDFGYCLRKLGQGGHKGRREG